jgi:KDO2-lipid IV(A) lauroyltransferase
VRWDKELRYFLGYHLVRGLWAVGGFMPLSLLRKSFGFLGLLAGRLAKKDCQRARRHLQWALGRELDCEAVLQGCAWHLGQLLGEALWLAKVKPAKLLQKTQFVGLEHLEEALSRQRGVVLVSGHCGNWEWINLALQARGIPMTVAGRQLQDPRLDRLLVKLRTRFGSEAIARGANAGATLLRALRHRRVVALLIDQDIAAPGAFVWFFGKPAWTPIGAALLALRAQAPLVVGFAVRTPEGLMELRFQPPIPPTGDSRKEEDIAQLTALLTGRIEEHIRQHPEQWVWFHQRWRRQPPENTKVWGF